MWGLLNLSRTVWSVGMRARVKVLSNENSFMRKTWGSSWITSN